MDFYDRVEELRALEERWAGSRAEFYVLWGRRRVGKTELISAFLEGKRGLLFEATSGTELDQLRDLSRVLAEASGRDLLREQPLTTWPAALAAIEEFARDGRTVVAIDEFQYIAASRPDIGSVISRWWRERGRRLPIFLILSGSEVAFFEREVLGSSAPLYGRRTGQQQLKPFGYRDAALFVPRYSPEDRIRTYAICGGMPYYLEQFDASRPVRDNILGAILEMDGVLREEARLLLCQELPDPRTYFSVLRALADGATRVSEIANRTGLSAPSVTKMLDLLQRLFLVRRNLPVTTGGSARSRQTSYEITDGYLRFWFRFVLPFEDRLHRRSDAEKHLDSTVMPELDHFVSKPAFEEVARQYVSEVEQAVRVGAWWGQVPTGEARKTQLREVDVVALDGRGRALALGTCKWTTEPMGAGEAQLLGRLEPHVTKGGHAPRHYFFSKSGFDAALRKLARTDPERYRLVGLRELCG